jgi:hypothetical protein
VTNPPDSERTVTPFVHLPSSGLSLPVCRYFLLRIHFRHLTITNLQLLYHRGCDITRFASYSSRLASQAHHIPFPIRSLTHPCDQDVHPSTFPTTFPTAGACGRARLVLHGKAEGRDGTSKHPEGKAVYRPTFSMGGHPRPRHSHLHYCVDNILEQQLVPAFKNVHIMAQSQRAAFLEPSLQKTAESRRKHTQRITRI